MATSSYAKSLMSSLPTEMKLAMHKLAEYIFDRSLVFGPVDPQDATSPTTNFGGRYVKVTTSTAASQEFSVQHGLGRIPNVFWMVGNPRSVNSQLLPLTVSKAADANRLYFTSASTSVVCFLYVE